MTATSTSRTYGAANPVFTFTSATLFNGDTIGSVTEGTAATLGTGVGTPAITISAAVFSAGSAANYAISYVPGTLTITPAPLTVTATSASRAYGSANPAFTFTSATLLNGDTIGSVTEGTAATVGTGVGTPAITISAALFTVGSAGNYTITYVPGTLTITPVTLTVTGSTQAMQSGAARCRRRPSPSPDSSTATRAGGVRPAGPDRHRDDAERPRQLPQHHLDQHLDGDQLHLR